MKLNYYIEIYAGNKTLTFEIKMYLDVPPDTSGSSMILAGRDFNSTFSFFTMHSYVPTSFNEVDLIISPSSVIEYLESFISISLLHERFGLNITMIKILVRFIIFLILLVTCPNHFYFLVAFDLACEKCRTSK